MSSPIPATRTATQAPGRSRSGPPARLWSRTCTCWPFSGLIFVLFIYLYDLLERGCWRSPGIADGRHSEVGGSGAAVAFDAPVEAGEFAFSRSEEPTSELQS